MDYIADLWRSASEDLRCAARETVVSFGTGTLLLTHSGCSVIEKQSFSLVSSSGKKGHKVFEKMDQLFVEMEEEAFQNQETEVTIL